MPEHANQHVYRFTPMTEPDARAILSWRYAGPYAVYNTDEEDREAVLRELLDPRSPYVAARDESSELAGFFAYGSAAEVGEVAAPHLFAPDGLLAVGLGLRPDLTGQGRGVAYMEAGLAYAREHYHPRAFRLYVLSFNARAMRVYARAGFARAATVRVAFAGGEREFIEMRREA